MNTCGYRYLSWSVGAYQDHIIINIQYMTGSKNIAHIGSTVLFTLINYIHEEVPRVFPSLQTIYITGLNVESEISSYCELTGLAVYNTNQKEGI